MANEAQAALDITRNQLQLILLRAELCQSTLQCGPCASPVCEIVKEIRILETLLQSVSASNQSAPEQKEPSSRLAS
jgi:hypothetical protein